MVEAEESGRRRSASFPSRAPAPTRSGARANSQNKVLRPCARPLSRDCGSGMTKKRGPGRARSGDQVREVLLCDYDPPSRPLLRVAADEGVGRAVVPERRLLDAPQLGGDPLRERLPELDASLIEGVDLPHGALCDRWPSCRRPARRRDAMSRSRCRPGWRSGATRRSYFGQKRTLLLFVLTPLLRPARGAGARAEDPHHSSRQSDVDDQAHDVREPRSPEEILGGAEHLDPEPERPQQAPDRHADRFVVIDDSDASLNYR